MQASSAPPTWRILPTNGGHFRWVFSCGSNDASSQVEPPEALASEAAKDASSRLPSMEDIIRGEQSSFFSVEGSFLDPYDAAPPKHLGVRGGDVGGSAMFTTGSGRSVSVRQSSIQKARSILEGENITDKESAMGSDCFSTFRTGSGKSVQVRPSSLAKAASLFEGTIGKEGLGKTLQISHSLSNAASILVLEDNSEHSPLKCFKQLRHQIDINMLSNCENISKEILIYKNDSIGMTVNEENIQGNPHACLKDICSTGKQVSKDSLSGQHMHEAQYTTSTIPPVKFHTAGGRSISFSSDALKYAKSLLNDLDSKANYGNAETDEKNYEKPSFHGKDFSFDIFDEHSCMNRNIPVTTSGSSLQDVHRSKKSNSCSQNSMYRNFLSLHAHEACFKMILECRVAGGPLVDISNHIGSTFANKNLLTGEKKRPGVGSYNSSSFKKPRSFRFNVPLNNVSSIVAATDHISKNFCSSSRVFTRYPFQLRRKNIEEYFGRMPGRFNMFEHIPDSVRYMTADSAGAYRFHDDYSCRTLGLEAFQDMLNTSGASLVNANIEWVANHYKWIVWKLACLERSYPSEAKGRIFKVSNVLEELKYRYEREFNYGHRSAVKRIFDGDTSPSSMMILCVSAIRSHFGSITDKVLEDRKNLHDGESNRTGKIELTDGWYSVEAILDVYLTKQLFAGKLFIGQKLRIWGAALCGWVGPISPLDVSSSVSLLVHINGTYRAHWANSLGFCKGIGAPLAFRCIKGGGGKVPRTLVGITRIYPILYKERLPSGGSFVRSECMERKILQLYSRRRNDIAEAIISEQQDAPIKVNDDEEGAMILKILESSAEPEVVMAEMSSEQLVSFSTYQAKQEGLRQAYLHKKIEKAFEDAGLGSRDVTPFMKIRVMGLTSIGSSSSRRPKEGLITIWNPTEKHKLDLVEGQIYSVSGLVPLCGGSDILYLHSRGPSSSFKLLPAADVKKFEPFFIPRKSVQLSNLGAVPLASEFDVAAVVIHVGEAYTSGCHRKQWIFLTDGTGCNSSILTEEQDNCLLAISFRLAIFGNDPLAPFSHCLTGNTVSFYNLIKRTRDQINRLWVAEATENSTYSLCCNMSNGSHLKQAAESTLKWARTYSLEIQRLKKRVSCIIDGGSI